MTETMRAIVLDAPGPPEALRIRRVPRPTARAGQVLIEVKAFGLNRSELHFRKGLGSFGSFPRIPGIEATGTRSSAPSWTISGQIRSAGVRVVSATKRRIHGWARRRRGRARG